MPQITPRALIKALILFGFTETRISGSHHRFIHSDGRKTTIPIHGNEPIGIGLFNKIIKQDLKLDKKEFLNLLKKI